MATAKKRGAKVAPKPTVVDQIPAGWYPSQTDGPPPRPVDAPSGPTVNYKQFSIPDPMQPISKRMTMWMRSTPDNTDPNTTTIPPATGKPQADSLLPHAWPVPKGQQTSKGPSMAKPPMLNPPKPMPPKPMQAKTAGPTPSTTAFAKANLNAAFLRTAPKMITPAKPVAKPPVKAPVRATTAKKK